MTKEELMNAITGLPAKTQVYKIDDNEPDSEPVIYLR